MTNQITVPSSDLFYNALIISYVDSPRFIHRAWLAEEVQQAMNKENCRFVLLTAEPGAGKSTFMAQLAQDNPNWLRYFIRQDQEKPLAGISAKDFLMRIGYQLAAIHPELFKSSQLELYIKQRIGSTSQDSSVTGVKVKELLASPFCKNVIEITQEVVKHGGELVGMEVERLVTDEYLLDVEDLRHLALVGPVQKLQELQKNQPMQRITILVDALDELRYHSDAYNILDWLTNCPALPENIRFILSSRPPESPLKIFCEKQRPHMQELQIQEADGRVRLDVEAYAKKLIEIPLVQHILVDVLKSSEEYKSRTSQEEKSEQEILREAMGGFKSRVIEKAEGNLGYLDAIGRAIDQAGEQPQDEVKRQMLHSLLALKKLPDKLSGLYGFFLEQIKNKEMERYIPIRDYMTGEIKNLAVWDAVYRPSLGVLSVAREPLLFTQIQAFGMVPDEQTSYLGDSIDRLRQFLDVQDERYRLYHSSLAEFLTDQTTRLSADTADLYFDPVTQHQAIAGYYLRTYKKGTNPKFWSECDLYGLKHFATHLAKASLGEILAKLLTDYSWLQAKLDSVGITFLLVDYDLVSDDPTLQLVQRALSQAAHILTNDPNQLVGQLQGRLLDEPASEVQDLLKGAISYQTVPWLCPVSASLRQPEGIKFTLPFRRVTLLPDGQRAISVSRDHALVVWELASGKTIFPLKGHTQHIIDWAVTADGSRVISASRDTTLIVWNLKSGEKINTLSGHLDGVNKVVATPDGRRAVSASKDKTFIVWDLENGKQVCTLEGSIEGDLPLALLKTDGTLVVARPDRGNTITVWELENGKRISYLPEIYHPVRVILKPEMKRLISGGTKDTLDTLIIWDLVSGQKVHVLRGHKGSIRDLVITADGQRAVSASEDGTLIVWDLENGQKIRSLEGHVAPVRNIVVTPDGKRAVSVSIENDTMIVWNLENYQKAHVLSGCSGVFHLKFLTPDGRKMLTTNSNEKELTLWDLESGCKVKTLEGITDGVDYVALTSDKRSVVCALRDYSLIMWNLEEGINAQHWKGHSGVVYSVAITPDGQKAVSVADDGNLIVWDPQSGQSVQTFQGKTGAYGSVALASDGSHAVSSSYGYQPLTYWNLVNNQFEILQDRSGVPPHLAITPDAQRVVFINEDGRLVMQEIKSKKNMIVGCGGEGLNSGLALSSDGQQAIVAWDKKLVLWDLSYRTKISLPQDHPMIIVGVAITSDGKKAISVSTDNTMIVWNLENKQLYCKTSITPLKMVSSIAITPDGRFGVFASADKILVLWNIGKGQPIALFNAGEALKSCAISENGQLIVAGGASGRVHFLRLRNPPIEENEIKKTITDI